MHAKAHRTVVPAVALALAIGVAGWTGCDSNDASKAVDTAQHKVNKAAKDVKNAVPDDAGKKLDQAGDKAGNAADTAHDKAEQALKDATGSDDTKPDDNGGKGGHGGG